VSQGLWVLVAALVAAAAFGLYRAARDGRFRGTHPLRAQDAEPAVDAADDLPLHGLPHEPGDRATLLQFSSAFCAPCRATRRVLSEVSELVPGVSHVEVDAEQHLDVVRRLGIVRTPTTLVLDAAGREVSRATGAPTKATVLATLGRVVS
jgi:thiol-disulfide isomerase/thioredoxin